MTVSENLGTRDLKPDLLGGMCDIEDKGQAGDTWEREEVSVKDQESAVSYRAPGELFRPISVERPRIGGFLSGPAARDVLTRRPTARKSAFCDGCGF